MAYVKANLSELESFHRYLHHYLDVTATNYHSFFNAVQHLDWDDPILERVTQVLDSAVLHVNNIRRAIGGAEAALSQMEDALQRYVALHK